MTHHDKDNELGRNSKEANQEGNNVSPVANEMASASEQLQEASKVEIPEKMLVDSKKSPNKKPKKGSSEESAKAPGKEIKSGVGSTTALQKIKNQINCGGCGNNMRYSDKITVVPVEGKKIPKGVDGQYRFESPGAPKGQMIGVLCDTCVYAINTYSKKVDGTPGIDITSVVAVNRNGEVNNVRVSDL